MDAAALLDRVVGKGRWTQVDLEAQTTAKRVASTLEKLARLGAPELDGLGVDVRDQRDERTTVLALGETTDVVETDKEDGLDDEMVVALSGLLRGAGSDRRFVRLGDYFACATPAEVARLREGGGIVGVLEPEADDEGDAAGFRRPTLDDVPGEDVVRKKVRPGGPAAERKVKGPRRIGPVEVTGGATVTFDATGAVDQVVATRGPLRLEVRLGDASVPVALKGRAELRDRTWRAWGELAADLDWDGGALHAGDEIDIVDGVVAGVVLQRPGLVGGKQRKAGAVIDLR